MAIELDEAFLADYETVSGTLKVGAKRDKVTVIAAPGTSQLNMPIPPLIAAVALKGGTPGEQFGLGAAFITPDGNSTPSKVRHNVWGNQKGRQVIIIPLDPRLMFTTVGEYKVRIDLNDQTLVSIPLNLELREDN